MKLLIVTQRVDRQDPVLGFFHRWIEEFAKHCEHVVVIGQMVGEYSLPSNVEVISLKKEEGHSVPFQIVRFWVLQWRLRKQYDTVLVHMTPIWIVLGSALWMCLQKKMYLWYEVKRGKWPLFVALRFVRSVFSATEQGLPYPSRKQNVVGHGIDTAQFAPDLSKKESGLVVSVGRITPVKHYNLVLKTFATLPNTSRLVIAGGTYIPSDEAELQRLQQLISELGIADRVTIGAMQHEEVQQLLKQAEIFLHACSGGLDKVVLEAMASGCLVLSTSEAATQVLPEECCADSHSFSEKAAALLLRSSEHQQDLTQRLRSLVQKDHSLDSLIERMCTMMRS